MGEAAFVSLARPGVAAGLETLRPPWCRAHPPHPIFPQHRIVGAPDLSAGARLGHTTHECPRTSRWAPRRGSQGRGGHPAPCAGGAPLTTRHAAPHGVSYEAAHAILDGRSRNDNAHTPITMESYGHDAAVQTDREAAVQKIGGALSTPECPS